jgi:tRNA pseudouridine38-40 synthase
MVQIGLGKKPPQEMAEELKQKRGEFENSPAPAQGLYLAKVEYESYNN